MVKFLVSTAVKALVAFAALHIINIFVKPMRAGILNIGNIFSVAFCATFIIFVFFIGTFTKLAKKLWQVRAGRICLVSAGALLVLFVLYAAVISLFMVRAANDNPKNGNTTLVVLGCQVKNGHPSRMLRIRLDAARAFMEEHPECAAVVSGGKGADEAISEAQCMRDYLVKNGISEDRIYMEDKSTSTYENLKFSKEIIEREGLCRDITIVTDGYHQLRAGMIAKKQGIEPNNISAETEDWLLPTYWVREWFGIAFYAVFGR